MAKDKLNTHISIIIPAYNEEQGILSVIREIHNAFDDSPFHYEIIVVDDGSTDSTAEKVKRTNARLIKHSENMGYGAAIKTGLNSSKYDIIVITDGDCTYPNNSIPELLHYIGEYEMVVGARIGDRVKIPTIRKPAKWIINQLANFLCGKKIPDLNSGLRVLKKPIVKQFIPLLPDGFSFTTTISLAMLTNGYSVKYVPINYKERIGKSKIRPIRDTLNFFQLIIRTVLYFNPLKIFIPTSLFILFISILMILYRVFISKAFGSVSVIFFVLSIQLLALGMIADLINKRMSMNDR